MHSCIDGRARPDGASWARTERSEPRIERVQRSTFRRYTAATKMPSARLALALCGLDLVFVGFLGIRIFVLGLFLLLLLLVIFLDGRTRPDEQRHGRDRC